MSSAGGNRTEQGAGVPVVFSHGGSSDLRYWEPQRRAFAKHHRFVAFTRAQGGDADAHASALLDVIRSLGAGPAHVVGFSTAIALRAALRTPTLVRTLTIVEPNIPELLQGDAEGEAVLEWWRTENANVRRKAAGDRERAAALWFELVDNRGPGTFSAQAEPLQAMWLGNFDDAARPRPRAEPLTCARLRSLAVPVLALEAELGMPYSRLIVQRLADCVPRCRRIVVPGVTHFMSYQAPRVFNELVLAFIAEHERD